MKRFEGKVVLVTGGARNTGLETVDLFLREGAKVFFCGSSDASVAEGVAALESRGLTGFRGVKCDVSLRSDVEAMMDVIEQEAGRLDIVVSNAANFGLGQGTCLETTDEQFLSVLQVNVLGGFRLVQLAANRFFLRQDPDPVTGQRGVVVFVGSNSSERVNRNRITYVASKGAMDSMMKAFASVFSKVSFTVKTTPLLTVKEPPFIVIDFAVILPLSIVISPAMTMSSSAVGTEPLLQLAIFVQEPVPVYMLTEVLTVTVNVFS